MIAWQRELELVIESYRLAASLPPNERFGLAERLQRASASIAVNIAEAMVVSNAEISYVISPRREARYMEVETILEMVEGVAFLTHEEVIKARSLGDEVSRMLATLIRRVGVH